MIQRNKNSATQPGIGGRGTILRCKDASVLRIFVTMTPFARMPFFAIHLRRTARGDAMGDEDSTGNIPEMACFQPPTLRQIGSSSP